MRQRYRKMEDQKSRRLDLLVTWILLKGKDLNQNLKNFPKLFKLVDVVSKLVLPNRITDWGMEGGRWAICCNFLCKKITILIRYHLDHIFLIFRAI